jgi:DNA-binding NarL/FixJ family response regulator
MQLRDVSPRAGRSLHWTSSGTEVPPVARSTSQAHTGPSWCGRQVCEGPASGLKLTARVWLTPAEWDVLQQLLTDAPSNEEIGLRLGRSEETVKTQMKQVIRKMGVYSRAEVILAVYRYDVHVVVSGGVERMW